MEVFSLPTNQPKRRITIIALIVAVIMTISTIVLLVMYINKSKAYDYLTDSLEEIRSITGGQSSTISSLKDEAEDMRYKISRLVDIANNRGERIEELEDIIERAQSEVEDLQMHISFDWDNWTLMMDADNIMNVLNEY